MNTGLGAGGSQPDRARSILPDSDGRPRKGANAHEQPKSPAVIRGDTVEEIARHTVRWTSLIVLFASFLGAVMAFNGSWPTNWRVWEGEH